MELRDHDLFMDMALNPTSNIHELVVAGVNANNTALQDKSVYQNDDRIRNLDLFKTDGKFDNNKFNNFYNNVSALYNVLANASYTDSLLKLMSYHRDDIFAPADKRRKGPEFVEILESNPYEASTSIIELDKTVDSGKSIDELMLANHVLLNPTTAGENLENALWGGSPNDNFWKYFPDVLVQAVYEKDGTHKDPITGEMVAHEAGTPKLDNEGHFYYERLDGRDVYGKKVLSKLNVITTDGSFANQFDFFDSDDVELKSIGGSLLKNLFLVGSMYLPYGIGSTIIASSIAVQSAGLLGTLGKMFLGSDSPKLSHLEGWARSMNRSEAKTEYALNNPWCWENNINLIGDVVAQLKEQRFLFEKVPALFKGANLTSKEGRLAMETKLKAEAGKIAELQISKFASTNLVQNIASSLIIKAKEALNAAAKFENLVNSYNSLGSVIGRGYMTAITVQDMYGEAKMAGASDMEATMLTLGYAAAEYALISSPLGELVMPEMRASRLASKLLVKKALGEISENTKLLRTAFGDTLRNVPKEGKKLWAKDVFNAGKKLFTGEYNTAKDLPASILASAAGEGIEEVSEELLADFSKSCYNTVKWLLGDDTRINAFGYDYKTDTWNASEVRDRYGMSLIGGLVGGGIANTRLNYNMLSNASNMTPEAARLLLVYEVKNGKKNELINAVQKLTIGDKNLSTNFTILDNTVIYEPGTETNNLDLAAKLAFINLLNIIDETLLAHGAVSDNQLLDLLTLKDFRFAALHNSTTAGAYLQLYNTLLTDINTLTLQLKEISRLGADLNGDNVVTDKEDREEKKAEESGIIDINKDLQISKIKEVLNKKSKELQDLLEGKLSYKFVSRALFETSPYISSIFTAPLFILYAEKYYGKKYQDITDTERKAALPKYNNWKVTEGREHIALMADFYLDMAGKVSSMIEKHALDYVNTSQEMKTYADVINKQFEELKTILALLGEAPWIELAQSYMKGSFSTISTNLLLRFGSEEDKNTLKDYFSKFNPNLNIAEIKKKDIAERTEEENELLELNNSFNTFLTESTLSNLDNFVKQFTNLGWINSEARSLLNNIINYFLDNLYELRLDWEDEHEMDFDLSNPYDNMESYLETIKLDVENISQSPIEKSLDEFAISMGGEPILLTELFKRADIALHDSSTLLDRFNLDSQLAADLKQAILLVNFYKANILGSRTDKASMADLWGFNTTLNEVSEKLGNLSHKKLAEIDSNTADRLVLEIDNILNKLDFILDLYLLNSGQKLNLLHRVSTKKDLLIYKKLKSLVDIGDDDELHGWKDFDKLSAAILDMSLHNSLLSSDSLNVDDKEAFEKEKVSAENAIYDFFLANSDRLTADELAKIINPTRLNLYHMPTEILYEGLDNLDDNSFVWWLATRAAVKSSDFYNLYLKILDPEASKPIAPITTLELAVYTNFASIVNGNIFTLFANAFKLAMLNDWKNKKEDDRKEVLSKLGLNLAFADKKFDKYAATILPVPVYSNIVFIEGIPGSGKTNAVTTLTFKLLELTNPELLDNLWLAHGASKSSADSYRETLGYTDKVKTFGRNELMSLIGVNWKDITSNEQENGVYQIDDSEIIRDSEGYIRTTLEVAELSELPKLIFIDEISQFSMFDLDLIDKFAKKYGITVLTAGDFDLTSIEGEISLKDDSGEVFATKKLVATNDRFIRVPKLGVSMRTDNTSKTYNQKLVRESIVKPTGPIRLEWYLDDTGIYGDKIYNYQSVPAINDIELLRTHRRNLIEKTLTATPLLLDIDLMINSLKDGEKIGYIYSDSESPLYKRLSSETKYKDKIEFKLGNTSLGLEGRYYIIEANPELSYYQDYLRQIYTGMSRALLGSIIIAPTNFSDKGSIKITIERGDKKTTNIREPLPISFIRGALSERKSLLSKIATEGKIPFEPRTTEEPTSNNLGTLPPPITVTPPQSLVLIPPVTPPLGSQGSPKTFYISLFTLNTNTNELTINNGDLLEATNTLPFIITVLGNLATYEINPKATSLDNISQFVSEDGSSGTKITTKTKGLLELDGDTWRVTLKATISRTEEKPPTLVSANISDGKLVPAQNDGIFSLTEDDEGNIEFTINPNLDDLGILNILGNLNLYLPDSVANIQATSGNATSINVVSPGKAKIGENGEIEVIEKILLELTDSEELKPPEEPKEPEEEPEEPFSIIPEIVYDNLVPIIWVTPPENYITLLAENSYTSPITVLVANTGSVVSLSENLFHTFNSFELGVATDPNTGLPKYFDDWTRLNQIRIDNINGLVKIDQFNNKPIKTVAEYEKVLALIHHIFENTEDKGDIIRRLENTLGLNNIYCTFAIRKTPVRYSGNTNPWVSPRNASPYNRHISELTKYNYSTDLFGADLNNLALVAIIGNNDTKDILEVPIFNPASPFTVAYATDNRGRRLFQPISDFLDTLTKLGNTDIHALSLEILKIWGNNPLYRNLINLFKIFDRSNAFLVRVMDPNWTPARNLSYKGPEFRLNLGAFLVNDKYIVDDSTSPVKMPIRKLMEDPRVRMTNYVYTSLDPDNNLDINTGHPFILVSFDPELDTDAKLIQHYKQQLDVSNNVKPKVIRLYVLPPTVPAKTYLESLFKGIQSGKFAHIGNAFTSFHVLSNLIDNPEFKNLVDKKMPKGFYEELQLTIKNISALSNKNLLAKTLWSNKDWSKFGIYKRLRDADGKWSVVTLLPLTGLLDGTLVSLITNKVPISTTSMLQKSVLDLSALTTLDNLLQNIQIYYDTYVAKDATKVQDFIIPYLDGSQQYSIDGLEYILHGKLDSPTFSGNMDSIFEHVVSELDKADASGVTADMKIHWTFRGGFGNSGLPTGRTENPPSTNRRTRELTATINKLQQLGLDISLFETLPFESALSRIANNINSENNNRIALMLDGKLEISDVDNNLGGIITIDSISKNSTGDYSILATLTNGALSKKAIIDYKNGKAEMQLINPEPVLITFPKIAGTDFEVLTEEALKEWQNLFADWFNNNITDDETDYEDIREMLTLNKAELEEALKNYDIYSLMDDGNNALLEELRNYKEDPQIGQTVAEVLSLAKYQDDLDSLDPTACNISITLNLL